MSLPISLQHIVRLCLTAIFALSVSTAVAQPMIPSAPSISGTAWILMDANTGKVLTESNADMQVPPASLTKMMTTYVASEEIGAGRLSEEDEIMISVNAWEKGGAKSGGSTMFLPPNSTATVIDILRGIIIQSGNDASIAIAEHIAGAEETFAQLMDQQAIELGMNSSNFVNATGLPDPGHLTTARDMAILANATIQKHPEHYAIYKEKEFEYNGITQPNRNLLLWRDTSVDGLKTGHTEEAGFCLVASAQRDDMRLISVVMGTSSEEARATETQKLLSWGFRFFETVSIYQAGDEISQEKVWKGMADTTSVGLADEVMVTIPRGFEDEIEARVEIQSYLEAPLAEGDEVGQIALYLDDELVAEEKLVVTAAVEPAGFFARLWDALIYFVLGLLGKV